MWCKNIHIKQKESIRVFGFNLGSYSLRWNIVARYDEHRGLSIGISDDLDKCWPIRDLRDISWDQKSLYEAKSAHLEFSALNQARTFFSIA